MNYWAVGASFRGTDDKSQDFLRNGIWYDGYADKGDERNKPTLEKVNVGDILLMKSSATKGSGHLITFTKLKSVGIITEKDSYYRFKVKWLQLKELPRDFDGISYRITIEEVRNDALLTFSRQIIQTEMDKINIEKCVDLLKYKSQVILQGPSGTGKTRLAKLIAENLTKEKKEGDFKIIQFHPAYSYEDFVRGIVAETTDTGISYAVKNKELTEFAEKSQEKPNHNYVLIIDEINRANLPAVLGELIYALEYRTKPVTSMYEYKGSREIILPKNLYIIGTMNTADRSVGHIDYAIRRRFAFVDVLPDESVITNAKAQTLFKKVAELFKEGSISPDFKAHDVQIGHSYFIVKDDAELEMKLKYEIKPILMEYLKDGVLLASAETEIEKLNV